MLRACLFAGALTIASLVQSWAASAQGPLLASTVWVNELGSIMTNQTVGSDGQITGTYVTKVGCKPSQIRPLIGWYNLGAFTFTVNWQECNSLTSWTGNMASSGLAIATLWQLSVSGFAQWDSINAEPNTFTLQ